MHYATETLFDIIEEVDSLLQMHYEELTLNRDVVKLDPMWSRYADLERLGCFKVFTARDGQGILVGYNAFFLNFHMHYAALKVAANDVLFLRVDHRLGMTGVKLLKYAEHELKSMGVNKITYHVKFSKDFRPILHRMGYSDEEVMVGKIL